MKRGPYPLEQLAIIKQKKLEEAEKVLQEKKALLKKEEDKLAQLEKERNKVKSHYDAKLSQLRKKLDEGTTSDKIQQMKQYLKVVVEQLRQKEDVVKKQVKVAQTAKINVDAARTDLLKKQQDVEKIKTHRKQWEKEVDREIEQKLAIEADEIGSATHTRRKREKLRDHYKQED